MNTGPAIASESIQGSELLLASMRRLTTLASRASEPEAIFRALSQELLTVLGAQEVHVHHLLAGEAPAPERPRLEEERSERLHDLVTVYLFGGEGRLSYMTSRAERPPGVSWVANTGRRFLAQGPRELAASVPHLAAASGSHEGPVTSAALAPLIVHGEIEAVVISVMRLPVGLVASDPTAPGPMSPADVDRAAMLIDQAATALALVHARAEAGTDPVTGCMNHRAMRRRLHEEIGRAQRTNGRLSCMLFDLDDFKLVNDRYGHPAGDAVLREVAQALMGEFRAFDRVARYGGDEFVAILPDAGLESAAAAAGRALQRLRDIRLPGAPQGISASIGVAQWEAPMSVDDLLSHCDVALLRGKREGKGRVSSTLRDFERKDVDVEQL